MSVLADKTDISDETYRGASPIVVDKSVTPQTCVLCFTGIHKFLIFNQFFYMYAEKVIQDWHYGGSSWGQLQ